MSCGYMVFRIRSPDGASLHPRPRRAMFRVYRNELKGKYGLNEVKTRCVDDGIVDIQWLCKSRERRGCDACKNMGRRICVRDVHDFRRIRGISSRRSWIAPFSGLPRSLVLQFDEVLLVRHHCQTVVAASLLILKRSCTRFGQLNR